MHINNSLTPFSCQYTSQVPELLQKLNSSIAVSTYQAGKLIFLSPNYKSGLMIPDVTFWAKASVRNIRNIYNFY